MKAFLTAGAESNVRYGDEEWSPLDCAVSLGHTILVKLLIEHGADVNAATSKGETALHRAVIVKRVNSISALVRMGATVDVQDQEGATPLMMAVAGGTCGEATALLEHGADVNVRASNRDSSLHYAVRIRTLEDVRPMVALPLKWDADETAVNTNGFHASELLQSVRADEHI